MQFPDACKVAFAKFANAVNAMPMTDNPETNAYLIRQMLGTQGKIKTSFMDKAVSWSINSMLSGLGTPIANALSIAVKAFQTPVNDLIETAIRKYNGEDVAIGDVLSGWNEAIRSFQTALTMGKHGFQKGFPLDYNASVKDIATRLNISPKDARARLESMIMESKAEALAKVRGTKMSDELEALRVGGVKPTDIEMQEFVNESYDYMRNVFTGKLGEVITTPTKVTVAIDEFGKSLFRTYKIGQMVSREARKQAKKTGEKYSDVYERLMKQTMEGATEGDAQVILANLERNLGKVFGGGMDDMRPYENVKEYALREMFQERLTGVPRKAHEFIKEHPSVRLFVPFMKTPWNITKETFSYFPALAPIAKKTMKGATKIEKGIEVPDMTRMGAYYDLSWEQMAARQMVGLAYFAGLSAMWDSDSITGSPRNAQEAQAWKDQGKPAQSMKIGDTWIEYGRIEPLGSVIQMYAEMRRLADDYYTNPDKDKEFELKNAMYVLKHSIFDKTFLAGMNDLISAVMEQNIGQVGSAVSRQAIPAIVNQAARLMDDKERQASTFMEKAQQRIPVLREMLPEEYGLYGSARAGGTAKELTSIGVSSESDRTSLQKSMDMLNIDSVRPSDKLRGVGLTNEQLADYRKHVATVLTPRLEKFVGAEGFQRLNKDRQKVVLQKRVNALRRQAVKQYVAKIRKSDPEFARKLFNAEMAKIGRFDLQKGAE